jgi:hypothetical protein
MKITNAPVFGTFNIHIQAFYVTLFFCVFHIFYQMYNLSSSGLETFEQANCPICEGCTRSSCDPRRISDCRQCAASPVNFKQDIASKSLPYFDFVIFILSQEDDDRNGRQKVIESVYDQYVTIFVFFFFDKNSNRQKQFCFCAQEQNPNSFKKKEEACASSFLVFREALLNLTVQMEKMYSILLLIFLCVALLNLEMER